MIQHKIVCYFSDKIIPDFVVIINPSYANWGVEKNNNKNLNCITSTDNKEAKMIFQIISETEISKLFFFWFVYDVCMCTLS